jgi:hypothetical protein
MPGRTMIEARVIPAALGVKAVAGGHRSDERRRKRMGTSPENVETRADGRPPEEAESEDPEGQAEAILEESEDRLEDGARKSVKPENQ